MLRIHLLMASCLMLYSVNSVSAETTISEPIPYTSVDDASQFWGSTHPIIQDFESRTGPWETGFSIDCGSRIENALVDGVRVTDSVDSDDGATDGSGINGASWFCPTDKLVITFDEPVSKAGFVWTDGDPRLTNIKVSAYGGEDASRDFGNLADDLITGTTEEDRFIGIVSDSGVKRLEITIEDLRDPNVPNPARLSGIEIDHVSVVPEPSSLIMSFIGFFTGINYLRRRRF